MTNILSFMPYFFLVEPTGPELVNPCYAGTHDCDNTAQCIPLEGHTFQCQCATGYRGDGRNCYGIVFLLDMYVHHKPLYDA